ncbi:MAG: cytochrome P450, partial [Gammaproteobacteria bacterium]|nr:cytochrome P450 [Gammaproteobacteria bacterium]
LQQCVHESVRLHPSSPEAWRVADVDTAIPNGCNLKAGTAVVIDLITANRQPEVFGEDANKFNPNRARPSARNPTGLSFGNGMHACIGLNLAAGTFLRDHQTFDSATHQFGTLSLIVKMMLEYGIRLDPDHPPEKDMTTARETWLNFPVRLTS